ncbi:MAG: hypothetical protein KJZ69_11695 [Phycisphaerales bacterium]|nr:hypothetical protein [Phycisphaerales bacterium]
MPLEAVSHSDSALPPALAALTDAERRLREAAAQAAAGGEYDALAVITRWAKTLQSLASEVHGAAAVAPAPMAGAVAKPRRATKAGPLAGTPLFSRDADMLVKTARSRKSKNEYEHRAPGDVVATVAECLSDWRPSRKLLTGEQLLDAYAKKKGAVVSYQIYAALGWFGQLGLVRRHGRSGYSVPHPNTIVGDVQKAWNSLGNGQAR